MATKKKTAVAKASGGESRNAQEAQKPEGAKPPAKEVPQRGILNRYQCPFCGSMNVERKKEREASGVEAYRCRSCGKNSQRKAREVVA